MLLDPDDVLKIASSPAFKNLVSRRSRFGWLLTAAMLTAYFGFIGVVAFNKGLLARPIGQGVTTWGIPIGVGMIVFTVCLTGLYVVRANTEFDRLTQEVLRETSR